MSASQTFNTKYGPWALVTGAARGLGAEFSRQIAVLGINLVLVDVLAEEMEEVADEIRRRCDTEIRTIVADLSHPEFMEAIRDQTGGIEIGLLVSNAMFGPVGLFFDQSLEDNLTTVAVNVQAPLVLVQEFGAKMVSRQRGGIIMLSSASALQGTAYAANYAATKAYNLILAESLWDELQRAWRGRTGVHAGSNPHDWFSALESAPGRLAIGKGNGTGADCCRGPEGAGQRAEPDRRGKESVDPLLDRQANATQEDDHNRREDHA